MRFFIEESIEERNDDLIIVESVMLLSSCKVEQIEYR